MELPSSSKHLLPPDGLKESHRQIKNRLAFLGHQYFASFYGGVPRKILTKDPLQSLAARQAWDNHMLLSYLHTINAKLDRILLVHGKFPEF